MTATTAGTPARSTVTEPAATASGTGRTRSVTRRLLQAELRLLKRDPLTLTFVFIFPVLMMLIIGGSFGTSPDEVFPVNPAHWYVTSYLTVVIGATGLIMLPVHIASYAERGVLRRFAAAGFPRLSFVLAQLAIGLIAIVIAGGLLLAVAAAVYGVPDIADPLRAIAGFLVAAVTFVCIGVLLGTLLPSARSAQAIGLLLFFPSFLLGVGGPPPAAMTETLANISDRLPLALANGAIREPWLGLGTGTGQLLATAAIGAVAAVLAVRRAAL